MQVTISGKCCIVINLYEYATLQHKILTFHSCFLDNKLKIYISDYKCHQVSSLALDHLCYLVEPPVKNYSQRYQGTQYCRDEHAL